MLGLSAKGEGYEVSIFRVITLLSTASLVLSWNWASRYSGVLDMYNSSTSIQTSECAVTGSYGGSLLWGCGSIGLL